MGIDKYDDNNLLRRSIRFLTQQFPFGNAPFTIVHGELLDENGELLAAHAIAVLTVSGND